MSKRTIKVRLPVAVDPNGDWIAGGWGGIDGVNRACFGDICDTMEAGEARYYVLAELEVPEITEIAATVEPAPQD